MTFRRLRRDKRAATALEFAIIGSALCMVTFGIIETAILYWARNGLASVAAATARCTSAGYDQGTGNCTTISSAKDFAVASANQTMLPNLITAANVTVTPSATSCHGGSGTFVTVSITSTYFTFLPPPLNNQNLTADACFPM
jgi:Flp pilus assembly protein TadG